MESQGARLKKIRLEKGISLEDVHARTKIHSDIIRSLEDDAFVNLSPVYRKSFLKQYCKFLGVDPVELSGNELSAGQPKQAERTNAAPPVEGRTYGAAASLSAGRRFPVQAMLIGAAAIVSLLLIVFILVQTVRFIGSRFNRPRKTSPAAAALAKAAVKKTAGVAARTQGSRAAASRPAAPAQDAGIAVSIQALDDVWIQVRLDGKTVFQSVLKKGRTESWNGRDKVVLTVGSAAAIRLEVNGQVYDSLGQKGQVLRDLVINKDGSLMTLAR